MFVSFVFQGQSHNELSCTNNSAFSVFSCNKLQYFAFRKSKLYRGFSHGLPQPEGTPSCTSLPKLAKRGFWPCAVALRVPDFVLSDGQTRRKPAVLLFLTSHGFNFWKVANSSYHECDKWHFRPLRKHKERFAEALSIVCLPSDTCLSVPRAHCG